MSELTLIDNYRELNKEGQEKPTDYASDLAASGRNKKSNQNQLGKEA